MGKKELMRRFRDFCNNLSAQDRVAIIHHSDADGFSAGVITAKAVEKLTGKRPAVVRHYEYGNRKQAREAVQVMRKAGANKLIILDIGIDSTEGKVEDSYDFEKCLVIDHHKLYRDLGTGSVVFLKAQFFTKKDPSAYVTAKFAFDLFNEVVDVKDLDWLACIGIIGDMNLKNWKQFVQETIEKRGISLPLLYDLVELIASIEVFAGGKMTRLFWEFFGAKEPAAALESPLNKHLLEFKKEKQALVKGFGEKAEKFPELELFFYSIKARHEGIKSYVINEISMMHPDKTIILLQYLGGGRIRFSVRRQDFKVKVNDLLVEAIKGIPDTTAGGHTPAAAGSVPKQHVSRFKKNVIEILRKKYGKRG